MANEKPRRTEGTLKIEQFKVLTDSQHTLINPYLEALRTFKKDEDSAFTLRIEEINENIVKAAGMLQEGDSSLNAMVTRALAVLNVIRGIDEDGDQNVLTIDQIESIRDTFARYEVAIARKSATVSLPFDNFMWKVRGGRELLRLLAIALGMSLKKS